MERGGEGDAHKFEANSVAGPKRGHNWRTVFCEMLMLFYICMVLNILDISS